jgi:outer membrane receptor protein involved in Fe transport
VPRVAIERLEVVRGGGSDLYGSAALAGVVQVVRQGTDVPRLDTEFVTGQQGIANGALFAAGRRGRWGGRVAAEVFSTSGYFAIPTGLRGDVDNRLTARHHGGDVTLERALGSGRVFVRGGGYHDARNNGTKLQENDTTINQGVIGLDLGGLRVRGDLSHQDYNQTFSAIAADRKTERLTTDQHVPAHTSGVSLQWTRPLGSHVLVLGAEHRTVWGRSEEDNFSGTTVLRTTGGGRQHTTGLFAEDAWSLGRRLVVQGAVRLDRWRNFDGQQTSGASVTRLGDRGETATSPRGALLFKVTRRVSLTAGAYRAFRAPTLNELYRSFRVGNVLTLASSDLSAEKARGYEGGALIGLGDAVSLRATAFTMDADHTVANVTLSTTPSLIIRQRRNLGSIRSRGVEVDGEARMGRRLVLSASAAWLDAHVREAAEPGLVGRRVPQVPLRQAGVQLRYDTPRGFTGGLQARVVSQQYEDDLNTLSLAGYWTVDALVGHALNEWVGLFVAGENLRNIQYDVGRTPLRTVGPPRTLRVGLRVRLSGHPSPP